MPTTRILIVDDHSLFRESLRLLLQDQCEVRVVETCGCSREALFALGARSFDLVLLDDNRSEESRLNLLQFTRDSGYSRNVLVVTSAITAPAARLLLLNGCAGIIHKHSPVAQLIEAIDRMLCGEIWLDAKTRGILASSGAAAAVVQGTLNARESAVLHGVFEGFTNREIAQNLQTSESCVKALVQNLFSKLGVRTRGQLVKAAMQRMRNPDRVSSGGLYN